ncbi:TolC family protein [Zhouia sp. PK063]|uniref:TolC family protein n=1 Tax=Zhouia sp. PK063 TaxID=3373602 RepID=UPI00378DFD61
MLSNNSIKKTYLVFFVLLFGAQAYAQEILEKYIAEGLSSNLQVKANTADYEKSLAALLEIKREYGPQADVLGNYTRNIRAGFPIEDFGGLAGVIENSNLGSVSNGQLYIPPKNIYSGGVQITQPIFIPKLHHQKAIYTAQSEIAVSNANDFKTELRATIAQAYYQYLENKSLENVVQEGLRLAKKNEEAIVKLITVHKETKDALYKAKSNVASVEEQWRNAVTAKENAQSYFNFLLNKPLATTIAIDSAYVYNSSVTYQVIKEADTLNTYKLETIVKQRKVLEAEEKLIQSNALPNIKFQAFGGIQGPELDFDNDRLPFAQLQVSLSWNIFNNGTNKAKSLQNSWDQEKLKTEYVLQKKELEMNESRYYSELETHIQNYDAIHSNYKYAKEYYETVFKKYQLGTASILELTDAQMQLLTADKNQTEWFYELYKKKANYLKETGKTIIIIH